AITRLPSGNEFLDQSILRDRRVLHLVDQQVPDREVEQQAHIAGLIQVAQRRISGHRNLGMIGRAVLVEERLELCHRKGQQLQQREQDVPLFVGVLRVRQLPYAMKLCLQARLLFQQVQQL